MALVPAGQTLATGIERREPPRRPVMQSIEEHYAWPLLSALPLRLSAGVPLAGFRVRDLMRLGKGQVIASGWLASSDVPLRVQQTEAAWGEFEVVDQRISVRLTRLA